LFAALLAASLAVAARAAPPFLAGPTPRAILPGAETEITLAGRNLSGVLELWTSFAAETSLATNTDDKVVIKIKAPPEPRAGIGAIRLVTTNGLSNLALLMIDDLPTGSVAPGRSPTNAPLVTPSVAVEGVMPKLGLVYYRFAARRGEIVALEAVAQRLGSSADPVLRVLDSAGQEHAYSDDAPGSGADSRIRFEPPRDGEYVIELRDANYDGEQDYFYRLRLGDIPFPVCAIPLGVKPGSAVLRWTDWSGRQDLVTNAISGDYPVAPVSVRGDHQYSGWVNVEAGRGEEVVATGANDAPDRATPFAVPSALNGAFATAGSRAWFEFKAAKDQRIAFRARTRSLGSPCDVYLEILDDKGKRLAKSRYAEGVVEDTLTNKFESPGLYRLAVEEMSRRGGPDLVYRLEISDLKPGFTLSVSNSAFAAPAGEPIEIPVTARRRDYKGPIELRLAAGEKSWTLENATIPENKTEITIKLIASSENTNSALQFIRLLGAAKIGDSEFAAPVTSLAALRNELSQTPVIAEQLDGLLALARGEAPASAEGRGKKRKK
jgi:hypothetical protein